MIDRNANIVARLADAQSSEWRRAEQRFHPADFIFRITFSSVPQANVHDGILIQFNAFRFAEVGSWWLHPASSNIQNELAYSYSAVDWLLILGNKEWRLEELPRCHPATVALSAQRSWRVAKVGPVVRQTPYHCGPDSSEISTEMLAYACRIAVPLSGKGFPNTILSADTFDPCLSTEINPIEIQPINTFHVLTELSCWSARASDVCDITELKPGKDRAKSTTLVIDGESKLASTGEETKCPFKP